MAAHRSVCHAVSRVDCPVLYPSLVPSSMTITFPVEYVILQRRRLTPSLTTIQTIVSMSSWVMHHNEDLFPDSETFDPTRWVDPAKAKFLDKYLFAFGKGSRQCVGMPYVHSFSPPTINT